MRLLGVVAVEPVLTLALGDVSDLFIIQDATKPWTGLALPASDLAVASPRPVPAELHEVLPRIVSPQ